GGTAPLLPPPRPPRLPPALRRHPPRSLVDLGEYGVQILADLPGRIVRTHLREIADIAYVISLPVLIHVFVLHLLSAEPFDLRKRFEKRDAVRAPAPDVVHLAAPGGLVERVDERGAVPGVDVVAYLLSLVPVDLVEPPVHVAFDQVAQEAVQLDAAVIWPSKAPAPQAACFHTEVAA